MSVSNVRQREPIAGLHRSLADPAMNSINFLNEVMKKYPSAISFAPGAPNTDLYDVDIPHSIDLYLRHLQDRGRLDLRSAERMLYEYGPAKGLIGDLIAEALRRDGIGELEAQDVLVTVGAQEGIFLTLRTLFRSADDVLAVASPAYVGLVGATRILGVEPIAIRETDGGPDLDELESRLRDLPGEKRIRAMYVAPDHANPSGTVMDELSRRRLLELAAKHRFFIIEDTAYAFTASHAGHPPTLKSLDSEGLVILIGTFAKIALPGVRVGYVATDCRVSGEDGTIHKLTDMLARLKSMVTVNTSPVSQAIVAGMLLKSGVSLRRLAARHARFYRRNLAHLLECLERELGSPDEGKAVFWNRPTGGFFIRVWLPTAADERLLERSAMDYGVLWTPMAPFHLGGGGECELRLSCSYLSLPEIEEGVRRFARFTRSLST